MLGLNLLLLRYRAALSFVVPAALCVDAIHNAIVVARLYEERGKVMHISWPTHPDMIGYIKHLAPTEA